LEPIPPKFGKVGYFVDFSNPCNSKTIVDINMCPTSKLLKIKRYTNLTFLLLISLIFFFDYAKKKSFSKKLARG